MILDKEMVQSERNQLVERLLILEAKLAQIGKLEGLLEQIEKEKRLTVKNPLSYMPSLLS